MENLCCIVPVRRSRRFFSVIPAEESAIIGTTKRCGSDAAPVREEFPKRMPHFGCVGSNPTVPESTPVDWKVMAESPPVLRGGSSPLKQQAVSKNNRQSTIHCKCIDSKQDAMSITLPETARTVFPVRTASPQSPSAVRPACCRIPICSAMGQSHSRPYPCISQGSSRRQWSLFTFP